MEHTIFVPNDGLTSPGFPCNSSTKHPSITIQSRSATSTTSENETAGSSFISKSLRHPNIPPEITDVILELWRPTTTSRYESVLRRWYSFAISRNENPYSPEVTAVLAFLHGMYRYGCLYSGLCAARSALSSSITAKGYLKLSDHPLISRYLKGLYNRHPPLPKYVDIWDLTLLLKYYEQKENNDCLEFKELVKKTVILFIILGVRKKQALFTLSVDNIVLKENKFILLPSKTMKHTKANRPLQPLIYHHYPENEKLCIGIRNTLVTSEISLLDTESHTNQCHQRQYLDELKMNFRRQELTLQCLRHIVVDQPHQARQETLVYLYQKY